LGRAFSGLEWG